VKLRRELDDREIGFLIEHPILDNYDEVSTYPE
jgi:hypothetical protein